MSRATTSSVVRVPNPSIPDLAAIVQERLSRRNVMRASLAGALSFVTGCGGGGSSSDTTPENPESAKDIQLGFASLPASMTDACVVPAGYTATVLGAWGEPLNDRAAPWRNDGSNSAEDALNSTGMHHDGMHYFPLEGSSTEGLLVVNHEYLHTGHLHPNGATIYEDETRPAEEVRKEINAHGISVMHIRRDGGTWGIVLNSPYNRRLTAATPMRLSGPVAGTSWVQTPYSPDGLLVRGTNNNCGNGTTPWGTYLTAEENWANTFVNKADMPPDQKRMRLRTASYHYRWESAAGDPSEQLGEFARFDVTPRGADALSDWRNEAHGFGYLVEIDPYAPDSVATKRTAMGRFAHEASAYAPPVAGEPLMFYTGDDAGFEYLYRFVSAAVWDPQDALRSDRMAVGDKYLDKGTLYVARFDADGSGQWLPLTPESKGLDGRTLGEIYGTLDSIIIHSRMASDHLGATPMDRPEWTAVHPQHGDVYLACTNNSGRNAEKGTNVANPRLNNKHGHIIRWHDEAGSDRFIWDIFVFGSGAESGSDINRSGLDESNEFASPDGIAFDDRGILWIHTDNGIDGGRNNDVAQRINDQMLAIVPKPLAEQHGSGTPAAIHADNQQELRRFFVGPNAAEMTGFAYTPDHTTLFVNVQHPVNWPAYNTIDATLAPTDKVRPRSSTVAISRLDGGPVGE